MASVVAPHSEVSPEPGHPWRPSVTRYRTTSAPAVHPSQATG